MTTTATPNVPPLTTTTAGDPNGRRVPSLRVAGGTVFGLRLGSVRDSSVPFPTADSAAFWSAMHRAGLTISVRWLVLPASTVGTPGHVEMHVFAHTRVDFPPPHLPDEVQAILTLASPMAAFAPVEEEDQLLFALSPFSTWAWTLALDFDAPRRAGPFGFHAREAARPIATDWTSHLGSGCANAGQALYLMSRWGSPSLLQWTVAPAEVAQAEHMSPRPRDGKDTDERPLPFHVQALWSGAAGPSPTLVAGAVARALGGADACLVPVERTQSGAASALIDAGCPSGLLSHQAVPSVLPDLRGLTALAPSLRPGMTPRMPTAELPVNGGLIGHACDGRCVRLSLKDRLRHLWVIGQTGTGKTTLLVNRVLEDLEEGHGVALFDAHGEMVSAVRDAMPAARRDDLTLIDLSDRSCRTPVLNPLGCADVETAHVRVGQIVELLTSMWGIEMCGPVFQQAVSSGLIVLATRFENPGTLVDLPRLFLDKDFRKEFVESPEIAQRAPAAVLWWKKSWEEQAAFHRSEQLDYLISKFALFSTDPTLRTLMGKPHSELNLRHVMDDRGVLLCNLSRTGVNPMATTLLTGLFMQAALNAALSRADAPKDQRPPFFVYCDEFQRIAGPSTGTMLSEVRKYNLGLVLAHQFIDQLPPSTLLAVLGNVGTKVVFRVGPRDAHLVSDCQPELTTSELIRLPNFHALVELLADGAPLPPFTVRMRPPAGTLA